MHVVSRSFSGTFLSNQLLIPVEQLFSNATHTAVADVALLDEPTAGMRASETAAAVALIRKVSEGKTLVVVEHDMGVVFDLADRISVLVYGEILTTGAPEEVRANKAVQEAYLGVDA